MKLLRQAVSGLPARQAKPSELTSLDPRIREDDLDQRFWGAFLCVFAPLRLCVSPRAFLRLCVSLLPSAVRGSLSPRVGDGWQPQADEDHDQRNESGGSAKRERQPGA